MSQTEFRQKAALLGLVPRRTVHLHDAWKRWVQKGYTLGKAPDPSSAVPVHHRSSQAMRAGTRR